MKHWRESVNWFDIARPYYKDGLFAYSKANHIHLPSGLPNPTSAYADIYNASVIRRCVTATSPRAILSDQRAAPGSNPYAAPGYAFCCGTGRRFNWLGFVRRVL